MVKNYILLGLGITCLILIAITINQCSDKSTLNQNIAALTDSVRVSKNKNDELVYSKFQLQLMAEDLHKLNSDLSKELDKFSKSEIKNLQTINKLNVTIDLLNKEIVELSIKDSTIVSDDLNIYKYNYCYKDSFYNSEFDVLIYNKSNPNKVTLQTIKNEIYADIVLGTRQNNNNIEIFAYSSNPNVIINNISGNNFELPKQKTKRFSLGVGVQVGYGYTQFGFTPYSGVGLSLNYNIISF